VLHHPFTLPCPTLHDSPPRTLQEPTITGQNQTSGDMVLPGREAVESGGMDGPRECLGFLESW
jgi:hypothetical protein